MASNTVGGSAGGCAGVSGCGTRGSKGLFGWSLTTDRVERNAGVLQNAPTKRAFGITDTVMGP